MCRMVGYCSLGAVLLSLANSICEWETYTLSVDTNELHRISVNVVSLPTPLLSVPEGLITYYIF